MRGGIFLLGSSGRQVMYVVISNEMWHDCSLQLQIDLLSTFLIHNQRTSTRIYKTRRLQIIFFLDLTWDKLLDMVGKSIRHL
jgi:hypothetical protein